MHVFVRMCRSSQSVLVVVCVVTLSHHIQLGKSQNDGKLVCKNNIMFRILDDIELAIILCWLYILFL